MIELSSSDSISIPGDVTTLVGVIDLMNGVAVHAVQGQRDQYQPVEFCSGDPVRLLDHYLRLGIQKIYVADLDGITKNQPDSVAIRRLTLHCGENPACCELIFDLGWRGRKHSNSIELIERTGEQFSQCHWVAATEAMPDPTAISELVELVGANQTILSLDYRNGDLLGNRTKEQAWVMAAAAAGVYQFLVLDLASVGSDRGPTTAQTCKRVSAMLVDSLVGFKPQIYSGGGIRSEGDIDALATAGCNHFLLATALYPDSTKLRIS